MTTIQWKHASCTTSFRKQNDIPLFHGKFSPNFRPFVFYTGIFGMNMEWIICCLNSFSFAFVVSTYCIIMQRIVTRLTCNKRGKMHMCRRVQWNLTRTELSLMGWGGPRIFAFACAFALLLHHHLGSIHDLLQLRAWLKFIPSNPSIGPFNKKLSIWRSNLHNRFASNCHFGVVLVDLDFTFHKPPLTKLPTKT